jgi:predicted Zn-dependent protease
VTRDALLDAARRAVRAAGGEALARAVSERSVTARLARSRPTQATDVQRARVEVLCVRDGHTGLAVAARTDDDALAAAARRAHDAALAAAHAGPGDYPGLPDPAPARGHDGFDVATAALDPRQVADALAAALEAAAAGDVELAGTWTAGAVTEAIATSRGLEATDAVTDAQFKAVALGPRGLRGYAARTAVAAGAIDPAAVAAEAAGKANPSGDPDDPFGAVRGAELADPLGGADAAEVPVVLGPDAVADLLQLFAALAFDGRAWAEGRSALSGRLGQRVAAPCVSLSDSVRFPRTLPRAFDAEGTPKAPVPLIQDGVAHRVVHDVRSAAWAGGGATSTGHATTPAGAVSGPLPRNLVLAGGGAADEAELMAPIERGLYVTRLWYVNPLRAKETLLTGVTREGTFLIEDGRIAAPAREVRFTDTVLRLLAATQTLTSRLRLVGTTQFYGPHFAYGAVCPALRAQGFRLTGVGPSRGVSG